MKLERILFKQNVFDPKTTRGADNTRSFFKSDNDYDIELTPESGIVKVSCQNGRSMSIHVSNALDFREMTGIELAEAPTPKAKFEAVQIAEGAYRIAPIAQPGPSVPAQFDDEDPEPVVLDPTDVSAIAIPPRKRGRPRKISLE